MRNTFSRAIKIFFSPETIAPFIIGSFFLAILGNAIYDILKKVIGEETSDLFRIAGFISVFFGGSVYFVYRSLNRQFAKLVVINSTLSKKNPHQHRGLILLVSKLDPCRKAINYHRPKLERCWLICSQQTLELAQQLQQEFFAVCQQSPIVVNDIFDPLEFQQCICRIYEEKLPDGWQETDVIADFTGMTPHASVGMVLACFRADRPLQYTPAKLDTSGAIVGSIDPIEIVLDEEPAPPKRKRSK